MAYLRCWLVMGADIGHEGEVSMRTAAFPAAYGAFERESGYESAKLCAVKWRELGMVVCGPELVERCSEGGMNSET